MLDENDHRSMGARLDLFHFQDEAPGMAFWHPRGWQLYQQLQEEIRKQVSREGYREVRTPQVLAQSIWEGSGHWQHFRAGMMLLDSSAGDGRASALKPVSCPCHIQLVQRMAPSFRDLPIRLAEFGLVHRNEPSGALHGLFRLRQFVQDDGHIFCSEAQIAEEVARFCASLRGFYARFGFDELDLAFSGRPDERAGSEEVWNRAEALLMDAARQAGLDFRHQPGEGAFYGPKLEFALKDRLGRAWQCGTIQLDLVLPERFDLSYVDSGGARLRPAMLHRALFGSVERFLGVLLEHHGGVLPAWLCPEQVSVLAVGAEARGFAEEVQRLLQRAGVRAQVDLRDEALSRKVLDAHGRGVPFLAVVGKREQASRSVNLRERGGAQQSLGLDEALRLLGAACLPEGE